VGSDNITIHKSTNEAKALFLDALNQDIKIGGVGLNQYTEKGSAKADNVSLSKDESHGNNSSYIRRRLTREQSKGNNQATKCLEDIDRGAMSYNQAQKAMGWKKEVIQVQKDLNLVAATILRKFNKSEIDELVKILKNGHAP
jgi:hypothetical protein